MNNQPEDNTKAQIEALMAEGYQEMAEENRCLAEEAFPLDCEMILRYTVWEEHPQDAQN